MRSKRPLEGAHRISARRHENEHRPATTAGAMGSSPCRVSMWQVRPGGILTEAEDTGEEGGGVREC